MAVAFWENVFIWLISPENVLAVAIVSPRTVFRVAISCGN
jgi:hypothetical protein